MEAKAPGQAWPGLDGEGTLAKATSLGGIPSPTPFFVFQHLDLSALSPEEYSADPNAVSVHSGKALGLRTDWDLKSSAAASQWGRWLEFSDSNFLSNGTVHSY